MQMEPSDQQDLLLIKEAVAKESHNKQLNLELALDQNIPSSQYQNLQDFTPDPTINLFQEGLDPKITEHQGRNLSTLMLLNCIFLASSIFITALGIWKKFCDSLKLESETDILPLFVVYFLYVNALMMSIIIFKGISKHVKENISIYEAFIFALLGIVIIISGIFVGALFRTYVELLEAFLYRLPILVVLHLLGNATDKLWVSDLVGSALAFAESGEILGFPMTEIKFWMFWGILSIANGNFTLLIKKCGLFLHEKVRREEFTFIILSLATVSNGFVLRFIL